MVNSDMPSLVGCVERSTYLTLRAEADPSKSLCRLISPRIPSNGTCLNAFQTIPFTKGLQLWLINATSPSPC